MWNNRFHRYGVAYDYVHRTRADRAGRADHERVDPDLVDPATRLITLPVQWAGFGWSHLDRIIPDLGELERGRGVETS